MGGQTAFGYEQTNGTVLYACTFSAVMFEEIRDDVIHRRVRYNADLTEAAGSVEEYFSKELDDEEDTFWRVLYRLDGTTLCRNCLWRGDIIFRPLNWQNTPTAVEEQQRRGVPL
jgi:hypothetical protein